MTPSLFGQRILLVIATMAGLMLLACIDGGQAACPDGLEPHTEFTLYFGLEQGDGSEVSDEDWQAFLADVVTPRFPDGLTVIDARGQWLDTDADRLYREGTNMLNILVPIDATEEAKRSLDQISSVYVERFDQRVVFKTSREACAGF